MSDRPPSTTAQSSDRATSSGKDVTATSAAVEIGELAERREPCRSVSNCRDQTTTDCVTGRTLRLDRLDHRAARRVVTVDERAYLADQLAGVGTHSFETPAGEECSADADDGDRHGDHQPNRASGSGETGGGDDDAYARPHTQRRGARQWRRPPLCARGPTPSSRHVRRVHPDQSCTDSVPVIEQRPARAFVTSPAGHGELPRLPLLAAQWTHDVNRFMVAGSTRCRDGGRRRAARVISTRSCRSRSTTLPAGESRWTLLLQPDGHVEVVARVWRRRTTSSFSTQTRVSATCSRHGCGAS